MARNLSHWFGQGNRVDEIDLTEAKSDGTKVGKLAEGCLRIIGEPGFSRDLASQQYIVGFFMRFASTWPAHCQPLVDPFLESTGMSEARFVHLIAMPYSPEVVRMVRSALKAGLGEARDPLPGEEIYPRNNWLGQYLNYVENTESPLSYHFWCGVAVLGAACRRNVYFQWGYDLFPNYYLIIVGPSALGKGLAIDKTTPLIWEANDHYKERMLVHRGIDGPMADGAWPNRQVAVLPNKPSPQDIVRTLSPKDDDVGDPKDGPVVTLKGVDSVGWLANGEVSTWLARRDSMADGCIKLITEMYNCEEKGFSQGTIARGREELKFQCLNMLLGSTLGWINKSVSSDMLQEGFVRRCMFIYRNEAETPDYSGMPPPPLDPLQATVLSMQMATWMNAKEPKEVVPDRHALKLIGDMKRKNKVESRQPEIPRMLPYLLGKPNVILKMATILTVNRYTSPDITPNDILLEPHLTLSGEDMEKAIELVEFEEFYLPECFSRMGEHTHAEDSRKIQGLVTSYCRHHKEPMPNSLLARKAKPDMGDNWKKRAQGLVDEDRLRLGKLRGRPGRPQTVYWDPEVLKYEEEGQ